ncbi:serine/threonine-protein phosphatase 6 regulatory subunit 2-like isoform X2 [Scleropages formosus]|uniref:serine/threonine-protein phosphatase 6 regulatory subunit 2-like isoform X2 n=1 Tax=Scleropages formosus TaxID=113540 RepID=UPI00087853A7|nr:serine/threonine-protein phosphatase 6 regulatory subunit 2-like isoform X2 [Scleropages formosus]
MFWKFDLHTTSNVDKLLDKEDVTLRELMDEDDVLQECKAQNRRLLLFLSQDHCMQELVNLITQEPPDNVDEKIRFKYPNIACELLTSDVNHINDKLGGDESLLDKLYSFLDHEPPLNPLLASFFSKTIGNLIARKTEQVIGFLRKKEGFISLVLKHIDASAMMDLLLRLISCVEPAPLRLEVLNWLNEEKLIQRLIELIRFVEDEERQSNASQTLCDVIRLSRDQATQMQDSTELDPLLAVLESQQSVEDLLNNMFSGNKSEACIVNGTQVLLTLLETRRPGVEGLLDLCSQGYERSYTVNSSILQGIGAYLQNFHQVLLEPPKKSAMLTTIGVLEEPLGSARLHIARLVASLLQSCTASIAAELCRLNTMDLLLDLFFKYTWNNFLHSQVELCVATILNPHPGVEESLKSCPGSADGPEKQSSSAEMADNPSQNTLVAHLFQKCRLVQRILDAWEENDKIQAEGGMRRGYMGHLTRIANTVVQNMEKGPVQVQISDIIKELPEDCRGRWESFVDETLTETNRRNTVDLVSTHNLHSSSEDDDMESPFPNELSLQQAFSDYQIQQMTANFVDQFGFNDEEFAEHEDNINATFDRIAEINFNLDVDNDGANIAMFEACCKERIQQFDDAEEEDDDIWEDKEINYATQVKARTRFGISRSSDSSSRSDAGNGKGARSLGSDEDDEADEELRPKVTAPHAGKGRNESQPKSPEAESPESPGWTASFEELLTSKDLPARTAADPGPGTWDSATSQGDAEDKEWAKFPDFQPFCRSEPRNSSPAESSSSLAERTKSSPDADCGAHCAWSVCSTRKAPLVASDSSSSGGSDSEDDDEDKADVVTETIATAAGKETVKLTVDAKHEKAVFTSTADSRRVFKPAALCPDVDSLPLDSPTVTDCPPGDGTEPTGDPLDATPPSSDSDAADLTVTDRKDTVPPLVEAALNGPV